jgi:hypothetical protein
MLPLLNAVVMAGVNSGILPYLLRVIDSSERYLFLALDLL